MLRYVLVGVLLGVVGFLIALGLVSLPTNQVAEVILVVVLLGLAILMVVAPYLRRRPL